MIQEDVKPQGTVEMIIEDINGKVEVLHVKNAILQTGRMALASCIANDINGSFNLFVARMVFGDGGTNSNVPKYIDASRNGLFGTTRSSKNIIANIDSNNLTQVVFTSVLTFGDANGFPLNEMALVLNTGDFYSMTTFPDINKVSTMQITFNWRISFI